MLPAVSFQVAQDVAQPVAVLLQFLLMFTQSNGLTVHLCHIRHRELYPGVPAIMNFFPGRQPALLLHNP